MHAPFTYEAAKARIAEIEANVKAASAALQAFPRGPNGLTPDAVKFSPEFKAARHAYEVAADQLRGANESFVRQFRKEIRAERRNRRA